jgi:PAS domain S-box-containing protein
MANRAPVDELVDALPCGIVSFTDEGRILFANRTLATLLGYEPDDLPGKHVESLLTVAGRIFYQTHFFPLLRLHGKVEEVFLLLRKKDGADVGTLCNGARRERDGVLVNDCVLMEVRERRKYEDELLRARREAEAANAALAARSRAVEEANEQLQEQARALAMQHQQLEEQAAELEVQQEELQTANDELLTRTDELERARASADEANQAKSQFLATMSHELRTPLNAIGGYAQLIEMGVHGPISDGQREALERITRSQRHLLRLVNEVLNLARIESGRVDYAVDDVPIDAVIASVTPMVEPQIAAGDLTFGTSVAPGTVARADRDKLQQVLINLLTNAIKFTPAGGRVSIDADPDGSDGSVRVRVHDSGIGIRAEQLDSIFEPFVQVEVAPTRRREGTGLGLAISRDLARGMGGDLTAESTPGVGSSFTLTLPRA